MKKLMFTQWCVYVCCDSELPSGQIISRKVSINGTINVSVNPTFFNSYFLDFYHPTQNEIILFDLEFGEDTYSRIMNTYNNILKEIEYDKQRQAEGWKSIV